MRNAAVVLCFSLFFVVCFAHVRFVYPSPRDSNPGIKGPYPCGPDAFWGDGQNITSLSPGPMNITYEETINHNGAPFRLAISVGDDSNYDKMILLDQVPHNDLSKVPKPYSIVVTIPDINCPRCSIQILEIMTDKLSSQTPCCTYPLPPSNPPPAGTILCPSVYHSCANIRILGKTPPSEFVRAYNGPCGAYNKGNSAPYTDYRLTNPDYAPGLVNNCPGWQRSCKTAESTIPVYTSIA